MTEKDKILIKDILEQKLNDNDVLFKRGVYIDDYYDPVEQAVIDTIEEYLKTQAKEYSVEDDPLKCIKCNGTGIYWYPEGTTITGSHYVRRNLNTLKERHGIKCDRCNGKGLMV